MPSIRNNPGRTTANTSYQVTSGITFPFAPSYFPPATLPYNPNPTDFTTESLLSADALLAEQQKKTALDATVRIRDLRGYLITDTQAISGDYLTSQNTIAGPLNPTGDSYSPADDQSLFSYAGSDMRVFLEPNNDPDLRLKGGTSRGKQLIELTTLSISVHREKSLVRAVSYINPKGIARGTRTIAGTMILTQFNVDVMYRYLDVPSPNDISSDSFYHKPDQLPPFNLILMFADELGNVSVRRLIGVEPVTDGTTYSSMDMFTEQTISYYAMDFTPLVPFHRSSLLHPSVTAGKTSPQKTVRQVRNAPLGS